MLSVPGTGHLVAGRYRLLGQLGRGAMGIVWRGRDELLDRDVAVKQIVLAPLATQTEAEASYERTLREARTAARLSHPGVVTVFDVVEEDGSPWIVMELVQARPLDQVIAEDGPLPPAHAARLGLNLLDALAAAHAAGVLHRDVKPSNVLIRPDGKAILTDFGIATIAGDPALTLAGMVVGTPGFSPPERVRGAAATPASDLWSLGATLYAAVEGRGPFDRAGGSMAIVASIATEPAPRAPSAGPLAPVIDALLRADPDERPDAQAAAGMLAQALDAAGRPGSHARPAADAGAGGAVVAAGAGGAGGLPPGERLLAGFAAAPEPVPADLDATTATQFVGVRGDAGPGAAAAARAAHAPAAGLAEAPGAADALAPVAASAGAASGAADAASAGAAARVAGGVAGGVAAGEAGGRERRAATGRQATTTPDPTAGTGLAAGEAAASSATDVVPDLMATPVFADLKMPGPVAAGGQMSAGSLDAAGPLPPGGSPPAGGSRRASAAGGARRRPRRGLIAAGSAAAAVAAIAIVVLVFPGLADPVLRLAHLPTGSAVGARTTSTAGGLGHPGGRSASGPAGTPGPGRSQGSTPRPTSAGKRSPSAKPTPSGKPTSGKPSPSGSPTSSASPSPTPSHTSPSPAALPPGFAWRSVSAATAGTTAGFQLAAPASWVLTAGVDSYLRPLAGIARLAVDMSPFTYQRPVREAKYLQATTRGSYHGYHLISIVATRYHGSAAATWVFSWKPKLGASKIDVTALIFTAKTLAGPQPYILSMSAPAAKAGWASRIVRVALRTFSPLPG